MENSVKDVLRLITYLQETICEDGLWIKHILNRKLKPNNTKLKLKDAIPE